MHRRAGSLCFYVTGMYSYLPPWKCLVKHRSGTIKGLNSQNQSWERERKLKASQSLTSHDVTKLQWSKPYSGIETDTQISHNETIENPEINSYLWFLMRSKHIQLQKDNCLPVEIMGKLNSHMQKNETEVRSYSKHKINLKWVKI